MINISKSSFYSDMAKTDVQTCLNLIGNQYQLLDQALMKLAQNETVMTDDAANESCLLKNKELLLVYASEITCANLRDLSAKIDFFDNILHAETLGVDCPPESILVRSIFKDIQLQASSIS